MDSYGDGNVYRGQVLKDSEIKTIEINKQTPLYDANKSLKDRITELEAELGRLRATLQNIILLDPEKDSENGYNEWGEAECFIKAQKLAKQALGVLK